MLRLQDPALLPAIFPLLPLFSYFLSLSLTHSFCAHLQYKSLADDERSALSALELQIIPEENLDQDSSRNSSSRGSCGNGQSQGEKQASKQASKNKENEYMNVHTKIAMDGASV